MSCDSWKVYGLSTMGSLVDSCLPLDQSRTGEKPVLLGLIDVP